MPRTPPTALRRAGVQSVEVGASLLRALADADGPTSITMLARAAGMSSAKAHRYLVSYIQAGLVVQSERSGSYDLGPLAVRLGLAALDRYDVVRVASERLGSLRDEVEQTVLFSVWTDAGPTVARIELPRHPVTLAVRVGTTFPILTTATGRIFLTYAPDLVGAVLVSEELVAAQAARVTHAPKNEAAVEKLRRETRSAGLATVDQTFLVGVSAIAVPVLHGDGRLAGALTVIGRPDALDLSPQSTEARALQTFARGCSAATAAAV